MRRVVAGLVPGLPVFDVQSMATRTAVATAQARFSAALLSMFAAAALALAVIGIYGVMSFMVVQRTREIGIRMALGADRERVQRMVIAEGLALAGTGTAVGVAAAFSATRVLGAMLFDVKPGDPLTVHRDRDPARPGRRDRELDSRAPRLPSRAHGGT